MGGKGRMKATPSCLSYQSYLPFHPVPACHLIRWFVNVSVRGCCIVSDVLLGFRRVELHRLRSRG